MNKTVFRFLKIRCLSCFILSTGLAFLFVHCLRFIIPQQLVTHTDTVGYPIWANFNIDRLVLLFYLPLLLLGPLSYLLFRIFSRFAVFNDKRMEASGVPRPVIYPIPSIKGFKQTALSLFKLIFVGMTLSLITLSKPGWLNASFFWQCIFLATSYTLLGVILAVAVQRLLPNWNFRARLSLVNTVWMPLTLLSLYVASQSTRILSSGMEIPLPWMPISFILLGTCVATSFTYRKCYQSTNDTIGSLESNALFLICVPVLLFFNWTNLSPQLGPMCFFHSGESMGAAQQILNGALPWRDFYTVHGLLEDALKELLGMVTLSNTRWGGQTGQLLFYAPVYFILCYLFAAQVYREDRVYSVILYGFLPFALPHHFGSSVRHHRFLFMALVLLLFLRMLKGRSFWKCFWFVVILTVQLILTPESIYLGVGCGLAVFFSELTQLDTKKSLTQNFYRTFSSGLSVLIIVGNLFLFLHSQDALVPLIRFYRLMGVDFRYAGGIPVQFSDSLSMTLAHLPILLVFIVFWYAACRVKRKIAFTPTEWTMGAITVFLIFYYQKFTNRADAHVYQPYVVSLPLLFYVFYRLMEQCEFHMSNLTWFAWLRVNFANRPLSLILLFVLICLSPDHWRGMFDSLPNKFKVSLTANNRLHKEGYSTLPESDYVVVRDFEKLFNAYLNPGEKIFDFSNHPALFHYLLDRKPSTRYLYISMVMRKEAQADLIYHLRENMPKLVIYQTGYGFTQWDMVPNAVRHYDVSRFLLENYTPFLELNTYLVMRRNDVYFSTPSWKDLGLSGRVKANHLRTTAAPCDWGFVPHFWSKVIRQDLSYPFQQSLEYQTIRRKKDEYVSTISLPPDFNWKASPTLEIDFERLESDAFILSPTSADVKYPTRLIQFTSLKNQEVTYSISVGSCLQWGRFQAPRMYLFHRHHHAIRAIRLIPEELKKLGPRLVKGHNTM